MTNKFYITGLPRSRTAWLANFFSTGDTFCYHEALNGCYSIADFEERMSLPKHTNVGDSDSGLLFIPEYLEGKKVIIIERDVEEVYNSLIRLFGGYDFKPLLNEGLNRLARLTGLRVAFKEINDRLEDMWDYAIGSGYDKIRGDNLVKLNISTTEIYGDPRTVTSFGGI